MDEATGYIEYMGQASVKIETPEGKVIYIDPYAGDDYADAADLILVTHGHFDHNALDLIENRSDDCVIITQNEATESGGYHQFDLGFAKVIPVQAGFNRMHDVRSCVGYIIELSDGTSVYVTGDTSTTEDMRDGTLASMGIDYAFWCSDGVYNMDTQEASDAARMVGARVNIPYHNSTANRPPMFDETLAESFDAPGALVLNPGDKIYLD
ncbi:MBL fold metallo-hydrolase [Adlercreutzia sp. R21]|uniref:MBL fold metallo-hydrolase n=1 Tax=Adlercreutzia wanghongyangiae TaxID=3111451 RepID=UPI002DBD8658|nr:MBL fold metallo-hydrolase [Adlercreutzia sp. R21]MEC4184823.1 MBL fold metallo-hydrolase [Adlercreutzia sp. R21]